MPKFKMVITRTEHWEVMVEADAEPLATMLAWEVYENRDGDVDCLLVDEEDVHERTVEVDE